MHVVKKNGRCPYFKEKWSLSLFLLFLFKDGYIKVKKKRIDVTLHSYDDPFLQKAVEYACLRFNESDRRTLEGQRIWMGVEGQNVNF